MDRVSGKVFDSIESAQDFVQLLSETIAEAKKEVDSDVEAALDSQSSRRLEAFRMVSYNLEKLAVHMKKSCRILNDLRSLRRLLLEQRTAPVRARKEAAKSPEAPPDVRLPRAIPGLPTAPRRLPRSVIAA